MPHDLAPFALALIAFVAAFVNGALGYGFSSITVPVALLFYSNRVLNPALALVEVFANMHVLFLSRSSIARVRHKVGRVVFGLVPAVIVGGYFLRSVNADYVRLGTYAVLLPLIFLQALGIRRPIRVEGPAGIPFGSALGLLYSLTTISGPPLALAFMNEGLVKSDFKAALALIRVAESVSASAAYGSFGLITPESAALLKWIVPGLVIGLPLGARAVEKVDAERFRRFCVSFDIWIIAFGLTRVLRGMGALPGFWAGAFFAAIVVADGVVGFRQRGARLARSAAAQ